MGSLFSEYSNYDGLGLAELVKKGEVSPRELADTALDALERLNPKLSVITYMMTDYAEKIINEGLPQGPFTGVPFLVKDLISSIAGYPTNCGSRLYKGWTRDFNSEIINRFNTAGISTTVPAEKNIIGGLHQLLANYHALRILCIFARW